MSEAGAGIGVIWFQSQGFKEMPEGFQRLAGAEQMVAPCGVVSGIFRVFSKKGAGDGVRFFMFTEERFRLTQLKKTAVAAGISLKP